MTADRIRDAEAALRAAGFPQIRIAETRRHRTAYGAGRRSRAFHRNGRARSRRRGGALGGVSLRRARPRYAVSERSWRDAVFANRGTLLALPAVALAVFGRPSGGSVALGVPVALAGEALRCWAVGYSGVTTRADHVTAPQLVTAGPYAYVRNPLYVGNFITALGFTLGFTGRLAPARRMLVAFASLGTMFGRLRRDRAARRSVFCASSSARRSNDMLPTCRGSCRSVRPPGRRAARTMRALSCGRNRAPS